MLAAQAQTKMVADAASSTTFWLAVFRALSTFVSLLVAACRTARLDTVQEPKPIHSSHSAHASQAVPLKMSCPQYN